VAAFVGRRLQLTVPLFGGIDAELGVFDTQAQTEPETTDHAEARERHVRVGETVVAYERRESTQLTQLCLEE
jgi:hypothetical protein